ncbi:MAG: sugar phosphate isomerase/epimerase [Deltaproteobacteria bacterium]|nr:sugar phosphate isomerase/epimerase [Deltaproteobacteria bacterium]
MKKNAIIFLILSIAVIGASSQYVSGANEAAKPREFFAFDNGLQQIKSFDEKANLLKELGYDGIAWRGGAEAGKMIEALNSYGLRMYCSYISATVDANNPTFDQRLIEDLEAMKKHQTIVWLCVIKGPDPNDESAVKVINQVADLADQSGLDVVLYPHAGFYIATVQDAIRLTKKVNRSNVYMSFNLCHFLKTDDEKNLETTLKASAPYLRLVSINGADSGDTQSMDWDRLIQPLGDGSFEIGKIMKILDEIGYTGPVGLQCYNVKGDDRKNLTKSMKAWKKLSE